MRRAGAVAPRTARANSHFHFPERSVVSPAGHLRAGQEDGGIGLHGASSAGLLSRTGRAGPVLASGVEPGDRIGITVEPAGGTSSPTTTPVIAVPV